MRTSRDELGSGVPAFLAKLWKLVEDPETNDLICWSPNGKSFFIRNQAQFARELLPHYYKHNNMASFVRQLNMYGFHKKVSVELGGLKCDKDEIEFAHQFFSKGHSYLLEYIKRKIASNKSQDSMHAAFKPELLNQNMTKMIAEVRNMKGRQESMDSKLGAMKHENEALWRELAMLRQKHLKQQQIVNKLIQFLVSLVSQPSSRASGLPVKRRYPLMIDDSGRSRKQAKLSKAQASPTGPVIHELDASEPDLDSEYIVDEMLENESPCIQSPQEDYGIPIDDDNMETVHLSLPDDSVQLEDNIKAITAHDNDAKKKRVCKDKKKRKNKVPVKILIPPLEKGDKPREELHLLEMPNKEAPIVLPSKPIISKPIPMATMRSSKLAAMAANISKPSDENDTSPEEITFEDDTEEDNDASTLVKLEDILIVPEMIDDSNVQSDVNKTSEKGPINKELNQNGSKSVLMANDNEQYNENETSRSRQEKKDINTASTSSSKDLSLSCVNSSGISEANYRSEPTEQMDTHLETMQSELENLREILHGEGYSIDANTLLGLFGAEDPMTFELPVNPELNPNCEKEDDENSIVDSINRSARGELMAYNPTSSLLDFDDDIFLGNASSSLSTPTLELSMNNLYTADSSEPLGLEDTNTPLLDSPKTYNTNSKS